jgi:hypothetical protein
LIPSCERLQREELFRELWRVASRHNVSVESKVYVVGIIRHKLLEGVKK